MKKIQKFLLLMLLITGGSSCKKNFLDEEPIDFLSTTNAFKTEADFNASVNNLYGLVRHHFYTINDFQPFYMSYRTDAFFDITVTTPNMAADMAPRGFTNFAWTPMYKIISEANTIISRMGSSDLTDVQKTVFEARARFFRAFGYRTLAYLYGGVPIVLEEITTPRTDFTRATKKAVLTQCIDDLKFAATNLPSLSNAAIKDGEISSQAANHLLAEVYIADGQFQNAVDAATLVINDAAMGLMTARFGRRSTVTPGDAYWDLFQRGNQNRKTSGNKESIWVIQVETDVPGGGGSTAGGSQFGIYALERVHAPLFRDLRINNQAVFTWPVANYTGGRGVGFLAPNTHFITTIWQSDFNNDIRNANHNFVRDFWGTVPGAWMGQRISTRFPPAGAVGINGAIVANKPDRAFYPYQSKCTQLYEAPATLVARDADVPANVRNIDSIRRNYVTGGAGGTYIDQYMFRLAETYLLRAEAYVGLTNTTAAANDVNAVRRRSAGADVAAANVNIDYILDERLREFGVEEKRMLTLMRMGKWVERVRALNPFYGTQMLDHYNLWPIPADEIERNRSAKLEQNPGYPL